MTEINNTDIAEIKEWIGKEPHLPQDLGDLLLKKFLHRCDGNLERTKECIERFCTTRSLMPEMYSSRDPNSPSLKTAFSITNVIAVHVEDTDVLFHQINDPGLDKFVFYDVLKSFGIISDYYLQNTNSFPDAHIIVLDMKDYTLKIIPKLNVMFLRRFFFYLLEVFPLRLKKIYVVNAPSYYNTLYALVKPVLPTQLKEIISFHRDALCLQNFISKRDLPEDYGGEGPSLYQKQQERLKDVECIREWYLNDNLWKADLTKKPKNSSSLWSKIMNGPFSFWQ